MKRPAINLIVRNARRARRMLFDPNVWQPALIAELLDRIIELCQQLLAEQPAEPTAEQAKPDPAPAEPLDVGMHTHWP